MKKILIMLFTGSLAIAQNCDQIIGEAGMRVPFGNIADKIGPSTEVGIWSRSRVYGFWDMFDIGASIYFPSDRQEFNYSTPDSLYRVKAKGVSGMAGFRLAKDYALGNKMEVQWLSTFGYAFFMYDDKNSRNMHKTNPRDFEDSTNDWYIKTLSTFHIGQGIYVGYAHLGVQINYNYTPYGQFSKYVPKNFGSHSLSFGLVYRT